MKPCLAFALILASCGGSNPRPATTTRADDAPTSTNTNTLENVAPVSATPPHELVATLERTACYGSCPIYKVAIYADGAVEWDGENFVDTKGHATGTIAVDAVDKLRRAFDAAGYFTLADKYTEYDVTDNPSANTSYHEANRTKSIEHYYGDRHAPEELSKLEGHIDDIAGVTKWIGSGSRD